MRMLRKKQPDDLRYTSPAKARKLANKTVTIIFNKIECISSIDNRAGKGLVAAAMPLVVVCGQPCSGKSTIVQKLSAAFQGKGLPVEVVDEPSLHLERSSAYTGKDKRSRDNAQWFGMSTMR